MFLYRLMDAAGEELGTATYAIPNMKPGDTVHLETGKGVTVLEVLEPNGGERQDVCAVLVVDA